ncbi:ABC transporter ATP-binding protein [Kroppenstedtia pulmonis]|uniref:ABC transporter ATP-binding protein n=1 Tax=Kroppenstedtia pulmonis TaxID=1380685 RepID=A0A7D3Y6N8_9BACL|nr:ABC transporter ATP-binding protein [Kroppenstedtia pulmonis]QKG85705.1 ABC transporter ATP-binding protein [Kroppenstedtia pulmonis]
MEKEVVIDINGFSKSYEGTSVVHNLSLKILKGEAFGLLGPNGAGKTTILESIVGLRKPSAGSIQVMGCNSHKYPYKIKKMIGVQPQEASLIPTLKVKETLELFSSFYGNPRSTNALLQMMKLVSKKDALVKHLSGGQKQRLLVAVAIISNPKVLFLDEPSSSLDPQARHHLWEAIFELKREGKTIILTTHTMEEAQILCDRVAILDHGRMIALGRPLELIEKFFPIKKIHIRVQGDIDMRSMEKLPEIISVKKEASQGNHYVTLESDQSDITLKRLFSNQLPIQKWSHLRIDQGNLEDVFLALTGRSIREGVVT